MNKNERTQKEKLLNITVSNKNRFYGKITLFVLSGTIMIGHGARMLYQGIFAPGSTYAPNTFDLFFDWLTLVILGCFILWFALSLFFHGAGSKTTKKKHQALAEEKIYTHPT